MSNEISEITRRAIVDLITAGSTSWSGRFEDDDFLSRLYDLASMPSKDPRMSNAAGDIYQHRVNWRMDWSDDWVFYDDRFDLLKGSDDVFVRFLCETIHPVVRPDQAQVTELVEAYNRELAADGWMVAEAKRLSARPVFVGQRVGAALQVFDEPTGWQKVDRQLQEVRIRLNEAQTEEQFQAVGLLCREVLITIAQEVFDPAVHAVADAIDVSSTDAKRMLEAVFGTELRGQSNEEARGHAKAALRLALALQHSRTADFRMAAICAEATSSVVNLLAVLGGRRGRPL